MQEIHIRNFGPITDAKIAINKTLVLIGDQASGLSTATKLISFYQSLQSQILASLFENLDNLQFSIGRNFLDPIKAKFFEYFGANIVNSEFEISYFYSKNADDRKSIKISLDENRKLKIEFDDLFVEDIKAKFEEIRSLITKNPIFKNPSGDFGKNFMINKAKEKYLAEISLVLNEYFNVKFDDQLYFTSKRGLTVGYSEYLEKQIFANLKSIVETNQTVHLNEKTKRADEILIVDLMTKVDKTKDFFRKHGTFKAIIENLDCAESKKETLKFVESKVEAILKGQYFIDISGEKIILNGEKDQIVPLKNASSGQQEVIRILTDAFLMVLKDTKCSRIIEEPEAHLSPKTQNELMELVAALVNHLPDNQLIITTHSSNILSIFNQLLRTENSPLKSGSLDAQNFNAYYLGETTNSVESYCQSIFDSKSGQIKVDLKY